MSGRDILLTGVPRSGTTLCCQLLGRADDCVALFEPMQVDQLPTAHDAALARIDEFLAGSRGSLLADGSAWSQQVDGNVPDNPFGERTDASGRRVREAVRGRIRPGKPLSAGFSLVVKHNAAFTALLPALAQRHPTWAVVRNPLAVLASWHSVSLPVSSGRLPAGEHLDPVLAGRLASDGDVVGRQLAILDWFFGRYRDALPRERVIAYENVVSSQGRALADAVDIEAPLLPLRDRNASALYDAASCTMLVERLLADHGAWRRFYREDDVVALGERMVTSQ